MSAGWLGQNRSYIQASGENLFETLMLKFDVC